MRTWRTCVKKSTEAHKVYTLPTEDELFIPGKSEGTLQITNITVFFENMVSAFSKNEGNEERQITPQSDLE